MRREYKQLFSLLILLLAIGGYLRLSNQRTPVHLEKKVFPFIHTVSAITSTPIVQVAGEKVENGEQPPDGLVLVTRVVDGDTIQIETGQKVRYIGVNTPESVDPRRPVQCFGKEASNYNKVLALNQRVRLVKDVTETDKYHRLLRYVYLADGTFVNEKLVHDGYATVMTIPPNVKYANVFMETQREAREAGRGLWESCR